MERATPTQGPTGHLYFLKIYQPLLSLYVCDVHILYNQNYWRALYLAISCKIAINRILNWQFCVATP